ncbi:SDR family NAD(P)-dependent oxidoreductase [Frateuria aurantia]
MNLILTGASRGLGLALASQALAAGWSVQACARGAMPEVLAGHVGIGRLNWSRCDLADPQAALAWLQQALVAAEREPRGPLQLILNAGVLEPLGAMSSLQAEPLQQHLGINLATPMLLAGTFSAHCAGTQREGRLLAISSGAARRPAPHWGAYCASKAGLDMAVRVLNAEAAAEARGDRFKAVSLAPGVVDTEMQAGLRQQRFPGVQRFLDLHAQGQLTTPQAAAAAILAYLQAEDFGAVEIDDIRNYSR